MLLVPGSLGLPCGEAHGVIGIGLEGRELRERVGSTLEGDLRRGDELAVLGGELAFGLQLGNDLRREGTRLDLGVQEHEIAVLRLEVGAEGAREHGELPGLLGLRKQGKALVPPLLLAAVELVARIDGVADVAEVDKGVDVPLERLLLEEDALGLLVASRSLQALGEGAELCDEVLEDGALVGHVLELELLCHGVSLLVE